MPPAFNHDLSLIGAPSDAGANRPGARQGPRGLRAAGLVRALRDCGWRVHDLGDLSLPDPEPAPETPGYHHLPKVARWSRAVHQAVLAALARQRLPVLLGGDHSLAIGSLSAVAQHCHASQRPLRVLWLDAHADCNTRDTSPSGNLHGMPLACLCGRGPAALTLQAVPVPALDPACVRLFGVRRIDPGEQGLLQSLGIDVYDMQRVRAMGLHTAMAQALAGMDARTHLHVSFDVDALDPGVAPGVSVPEPDGLTQAQMQECMTLIAATGRLGSLDVMEFNPGREYPRTARATVALMRTLLCPAA